MTALRWVWVAAALAAISFLAGIRLLDGVALEAFDDVSLSILPIVAGLYCLKVAPRRSGAKPAWRLLGLSCLSWGLGGAVWTWLEIVRGVFPFPSLADAGYLASYPLAAAAMLSFPAAPKQAAGRVRMLLDGLIVITSLLFCSWALVLGPTYKAAAGPLLSQLITLAYPCGDLLIALIATLVLTRSMPDQRSPLAFIGAGMLAMTIANSGFAIFVTNGTYATGNLIDLGWVAGYLLIIIAAAQDEHDQRFEAPPTALREPLWHIVLPYVPLGGVVVIAIGWRTAGRDLEPELFWLAVALLVALGVRQVAALMANRTLVAQLRAREAQLEHEALHDALTGLANRVLFEDRVSHALQRRTRASAAVLFYDLDDFKAINDSLGHHAGDALLQAVAERLRVTTRTGDTIARLGGDEFAVLLEDLAGADAAAAIAQSVLDIARKPYDVDRHEVTVTGSVGVAVSEGETSAANVIREADVAMYAAKAQGKGRYAIYQPDMLTSALEQSQDIHEVPRPVPRPSTAIAPTS